MAYLKLNALPQRSQVQGLFKYYFLSMSLATFLGGVLGHALLHYVPFYLKLPGWITSMLSVALLERAFKTYHGFTCHFAVVDFTIHIVYDIYKED